MNVATVLTVYGIETERMSHRPLQILVLQQYLPFTVLKLDIRFYNLYGRGVATVLTVYGIETHQAPYRIGYGQYSCNSTYRLRY